MPTPKLSQELMQEALDLVETHGSPYLAMKATGIAQNTLNHRASQARLHGLRPTVRKDAPRIYTRERLGRMHIVIPDVQCRPGVRLDHLSWVGKYIADKRPDAVICIGDFADLESLSRYDLEWGWKVHPFLHVVEVDGVQYSHYFVTGESGRPVTSAPALLRRRAKSAIQGHNQKTDVAFHPVTHQWAIFCGICNLHDEPYLGPQGNHVRRQILVLHEVEEGRFDPMFVSLRFLEKAYG